MHLLNSLSSLNKQITFVLFALFVSVLTSILTFKMDIAGPILLVFTFVVVIYLIFLFKNPRLGLITAIFYSFLSGFIGGLIGGVPSGVFEALLIVTWCSAIFAYSGDEWKSIKNDFSILIFIWFVISLLQVANPEGASLEGWMAEIRTVALYPLLIIPLGFLMVKTNKNLNQVLILFLVLALIACFNGIKQQHLGLNANEQAYLAENPTHEIWGKLRVFSFYDAAQFGSLQAQFAIIAIVLAFGKFKLWKRIVLLAIACFFLYGMLISGTRGVIIVIVVGAFTAIVLSKSYKILIAGTVFMLIVLAGLKFTHIGSGNYEIYRLRSALNPEDASLNVRFSNQELYGEYLKSRPFGGGLGVTGFFGHKYNSDKYLSTIEPDSFWVKIWAMYGIVGFVFWFCMYLYIIGKGCGIVWNIRDDKLRFKLIALLSGATGAFFCSYGNEIMNIMPSLLVVSLSLAMVYQGTLLDKEIEVYKISN